MPTSKPEITETDLHEYIASHAARLTPHALHQIVAALPEIRAEFPKIGAAGFAKAERQLRLLAGVVESFAADRMRDLPYRVALEAAVGLSYFHRDVDLIPDVLGAQGYMDDAAIIETIVARNPDALADFAQTHALDWSEVKPHAR